MPEPLYGYSVEQHIEATGAEVLSAEHLALPGGDMIAPLQLPKVPMVSLLLDGQSLPSSDRLARIPGNHADLFDPARSLYPHR